MRFLSDFLLAVDIQENYSDFFVDFASRCFAEIAHHIQEFDGRGVQALQYRIIPPGRRDNLASSCLYAFLFLFFFFVITVTMNSSTGLRES